MQKIRYRIVLDTAKSGCQQVVDGAYRTENDVREFEIILIKESKVVSLDDTVSAVIYGKRSDGTSFMQSCSVADGNIIFCPKSDVFCLCGDVECQVQITSDDRIMFSPSFIISVSDTVRDENAIESSDEFTALDEALIKVSSMDAGVPVYDSYSDLSEETADDSLAFVKTASEEFYEPVYLAAADLQADSTQLPDMKIRVSETAPEYDEETFRSYIENLAVNGRSYILRTDVIGGQQISADVAMCHSSSNKYPDIEWGAFIPTTQYDHDYALIINPPSFIYLDKDGSQIDPSDAENLDSIIQQYFYFYGSGHVYLDMGSSVIDQDFEKGWYAWKMVDANGDKVFDEIRIDPIDNPHFASLITDRYGYGNCTSEEAKKLLDGIFETPQRSGFYLKDGKWKNVVEGRRSL